MNKLQIILIFFALALFGSNAYAQDLLETIQKKIELDKANKEGYLFGTQYQRELNKLNYEAKIARLKIDASDENLEAIVTYDKYLRDKTSVSEAEVKKSACTILSASSKDILKSLGYIASICRTMPKGTLTDHKSDNLSDYIYCLSNGKILICNLGIFEFVRRLADYSISNRIFGFLYNPDGSFGIGYLIKKREASKKYFPNIFVNQELSEINKQEDYVIGLGYICNDKDMTNNLELFEYSLGLTSSKPNNTLQIQPLHCSESDIEAVKSAKDMAKDMAEKRAIEKSWAPYVKKYGATAVKRARDLDVWIGMPKDLALASGFSFVRSTISYGAKIEVYTRRIMYLRETIWIRNGKVTKVSTVRRR